MPAKKAAAAASTATAPQAQTSEPVAAAPQFTVPAFDAAAALKQRLAALNDELSAVQGTIAEARMAEFRLAREIDKVAAQLERYESGDTTTQAIQAYLQRMSEQREAAASAPPAWDTRSPIDAALGSRQRPQGFYKS
jgi:proline dehydrogenase